MSNDCTECCSAVADGSDGLCANCRDPRAGMSDKLKAILDALNGCFGKDAAISGKVLEKRLGISERDIRRILTRAHGDGDLDREQFPAIGGKRGFYIATSTDDYQSAYDPLFRAAKALHWKIVALKRAAKIRGHHLTAPDEA